MVPGKIKKYHGTFGPCFFEFKKYFLQFLSDISGYCPVIQTRVFQIVPVDSTDILKPHETKNQAESGRSEGYYIHFI